MTEDDTKNLVDRFNVLTGSYIISRNVQGRNVLGRKFFTDPCATDT